MKCPRCQYEFDIPLTPRQHETLDVVNGRLMTTHQVAGLLTVAYRTAYMHLRALEQLGYIHRPHGPRSGWAVVPAKVLRLVA